MSAPLRELGVEFTKGNEMRAVALDMAIAPWRGLAAVCQFLLPYCASVDAVNVVKLPRSFTDVREFCMNTPKVAGFISAVAVGFAANAFAAWTYDSSAGTLSDDSGTVLAVSVVTKYDVTGLQVNSVTSLGTNTDIDFTGFSTPDEGYRVISFGFSAMSAKAITSIVAPDAISCGGSCFYNCKTLTNAVVSSSIREISGSAFKSCETLNNFSPAVFTNVTTLSGSAFYNARLLNASFHFPAVTTCGDQAFFSNLSGDIGPTEIVMTNVTTLGGSVFNGRKSTQVDGRMPNLVLTSNAKTTQFKLTRVREVYMPKVTHVTTEMFRDCSVLTNAVFSPDLEFLGQFAFLGCSSLRNVNHLLTPKIKTICTGALYSCGIMDVVFNCPQIDCLTNQLFWTCSSLTNVVVKSHVDTLYDGCLTGLAPGVSIWFENGAPSVVATNAITYINPDNYHARARVYVHDSDLATSGFASQLEPVEASDKTRKFNDWPGKRVRGKVKGWYKYGATFRLSYYYVVGYSKGFSVVVR